MALAWRALRSHVSFSSMPTHGAEMWRILEASWPACLARHAKSLESSRSKNTTASPTGRPFLVPPKHSTSTPAFQVMSAAVQPKWATALAKRAPSMCIFKPLRLATSDKALTSSTEYTVPSSVAWVIDTARGLV